MSAQRSILGNGEEQTVKGVAVLGFNPCELARARPIEKFSDGRSFLDVARVLQNRAKVDRDFAGMYYCIVLLDA